jgi:integrase
MAIRQRKTPNKDGTRPWLVELPDPKRPGRMVRVGTYPTHADAKDAEFNAEKRRREGRLNTDKSTMTVADLCKEFMVYATARREAGTLKGNAYRGYRIRVNAHIVPMLGHVRLRDLRKSVIQNWVYDMLKKHPVGTTPDCVTSMFRTVLEYAADEDRGYVNVADVIQWFRKLDRGKRKPHRRHIDKNDLPVFFLTLRRFRPRYELPILIAITTGMRLGEFAGLQWQRCDLGSGTFLVADAYSYADNMVGGTKTGIEREGVEMTNRVRALMLARWEDMGRPNKGPVFPGVGGGVTIYKGVRQAFAWVMAEAGLVVWDEGRQKHINKFTIHSMRRFYLTQIRNRLGLDVAQESVGHSSSQQTLDYCAKAIVNPERLGVVEDIDAMTIPPLALPPPDTTYDTTNVLKSPEN